MLGNVMTASANYADLESEGATAGMLATCPSWGRGQVTVHEDRLHAEVDRELDEIRRSCDGLATRSGLLITATGIAVPIVAARLATVHSLQPVLADALLALGIATVLGILTLVPSLTIGPRAPFLQLWMAIGSSPRTSSLLYEAKVALVKGGTLRHAVMETLFIFQTLATIAALALGLWSARR